MDEKNGEVVEPESATTQPPNNEHKFKRRMVVLGLIIAMIACLLLFIGLIFGLVILRAKAPILTLNKKNFNLQSFNSSSSSTSFDITFATQIRVRNPNFGPYRFENTTATFTNRGATVGHVIIPKAKVKGITTKKIDVIVSLSSSQLPNNADRTKELTAGSLTLVARATMSGKLKVMGLVKRKRVSNLNCNLVIDINKKKIKSLKCKIPFRDRRYRSHV
ncbi:hypothetical protein CsatB_004626 [Cannabis sativa]